LLGADVQLIAANVDESLLQGFDCVNVQTVSELGQALVSKLGSYDILIMAAAVADYRPAQPTEAKLKRSEIGEKVQLELVANPDLLALAIAGLNERGSRTVVVGFAAEASSDLESLGLKKLESKGCDYIVANNISSGMVFGKDETEVVLISKDSAQPIRGTKQSVATAVLSQIASSMGES
jgi:phosphopantothenoylcysteine decarboxylase/phosphopantothenate--cysteine ligase